MTTTNQDAWVIYPPANSTGGGGGPGSDTTAIHDNVAGEISGIATKATPTAADILIIEDAAATFAKKKITIGSLPGGGGGGQTDTVVGSGGITNVGTNVDADLAPTYGSAASTVCQGNDARLSDARTPTGAAGGELGGTYPNPTVNDGADGSAIHDDIAGEILAVALKAAPVSADVLLIEDSAGANAKKRITIGSLPGGGGGGQTDTVVGSGGITNVGTNVDADMAPTYGSAASTICQGDDPRLSDARVPTGAAGGDLAGTYPNPSVAAITTTSGPTSLTIGAIADGEVLLRSGATVVGYVPIIACCVFGGKSDSLGKFLIANGKSSDNDDSSKPKTQQPIAHDGTLIRLAYKTKEGTTSTVMKVHIDGVVAATVTLANLNAEFAGVETISVAVTAGQYVEIEYDASDKPGECTMYFLQELTL